MDKNRLFCLVALATITLSACTIKKPPQNLAIKARGSFDEKSMGIVVESSLPKNAKLNFIVKDEDLNKTIYETTFKTDKDGSLNKKISFEVGKRNLTSKLLFNPDEQGKEIQDKFGKYGQNIRSNAVGYSVSKKNKEKYAYIQLYGTFLKLGTMSNAGDIFFSKQIIEIE